MLAGRVYAQTFTDQASTRTVSHNTRQQGGCTILCTTHHGPKHHMPQHNTAQAGQGTSHELSRVGSTGRQAIALQHPIWSQALPTGDDRTPCHVDLWVSCRPIRNGHTNVKLAPQAVRDSHPTAQHRLPCCLTPQASCEMMSKCTDVCWPSEPLLLRRTTPTQHLTRFPTPVR